MLDREASRKYQYCARCGQDLQSQWNDKGDVTQTQSDDKKDNTQTQSNGNEHDTNSRSTDAPQLV